MTSLCECDGFGSMWLTTVPAGREHLIACPFCYFREATLRVLAHTESWTNG